uniref:type I protein arginine methyltransferase n=1 Tax=Arcella intermedia TaxID=1963864 RepID=A0A6B2L9Q5_9EUKA
MTSSDYYWNSYAHFSIHEEMLKDEVRTLNYRKSILDNSHLFKDKIVLDVGCGTGILSMFAAKAGAKHVYAVDCSDIIHQAKQIILDNGFKDQITLIQEKVEDLKLPCKVDIILSEWMGYFLLYESMLNTVIYARDHFLKEGGILMPDKANMYIAGIEDSEYKQDKVEFWDDVYGFNMSAIKKMAYQEPLVDTVEANSQLTTASKFMSIDLNTVKVEELTFSKPFSCKVTRKDNMHAFLAWFDVEFSRCHKPVFISTAPSAPYTHWKQTVFYVHDILRVTPGEVINGVLTCSPNAKNPRDLDIQIEMHYDGKEQKVHKKQEYLLR